jgi:hypothetical protein
VPQRARQYATTSRKVSPTHSSLLLDQRGEGGRVAFERYGPFGREDRHLPLKPKIDDLLELLPLVPACSTLCYPRGPHRMIRHDRR